MLGWSGRVQFVWSVTPRCVLTFCCWMSSLALAEWILLAGYLVKMHVPLVYKTGTHDPNGQRIGTSSRCPAEGNRIKRGPVTLIFRTEEPRRAGRQVRGDMKFNEAIRPFFFLHFCQVGCKYCDMYHIYM